MSDKTKSTHTIHYGDNLVGASPIERSNAVSDLIREWRRSLGGGPAFVEHKGAERGEPVFSVESALPDDLLAALHRGFTHRRVEHAPAASPAN